MALPGLKNFLLWLSDNSAQQSRLKVATGHATLNHAPEVGAPTWDSKEYRFLCVPVLRLCLDSVVASQQTGTAVSRLAERVMLTLEPFKQLSHRVPVCEKLLWYGDYFMAK